MPKEGRLIEAKKDDTYVNTYIHTYIHTRKVDVRLPGKGNSNSNGARPVHLIITMIKWIRTSSLSIKNSLYRMQCHRGDG